VAAVRDIGVGERFRRGKRGAHRAAPITSGLGKRMRAKGRHHAASGW
jgi:hypothetical protein